MPRFMVHHTQIKPTHTQQKKKTISINVYRHAAAALCGQTEKPRKGKYRRNSTEMKDKPTQNRKKKTYCGGQQQQLFANNSHNCTHIFQITPL